MSLLSEVRNATIEKWHKLISWLIISFFWWVVNDFWCCFCVPSRRNPQIMFIKTGERLDHSAAASGALRYVTESSRMYVGHGHVKYVTAISALCTYERWTYPRSLCHLFSCFLSAMRFSGRSLFGSHLHLGSCVNVFLGLSGTSLNTTTHRFHLYHQSEYFSLASYES